MCELCKFVSLDSYSRNKILLSSLKNNIFPSVCMSGGVADNKFPVVMTGTCGQFTSFSVRNQRTLSTLIALEKNHQDKKQKRMLV